MQAIPSDHDSNLAMMQECTAGSILWMCWQPVNNITLNNELCCIFSDHDKQLWKHDDGITPPTHVHPGQITNL